MAIRVPLDYQTIQAAIDASTPGEYIYVDPGDYEESLFIDKSVTITRFGYSGTINLRPKFVPPFGWLPPTVSIRRHRIGVWLSYIDLHGGTIRSPAHSLLNPVPQDPAYLDLQWVNVHSAGPDGGIVGVMNMHAKHVKVLGSAGPGIDIRGGAIIMDEVWATACSGTGIKISNSLPSPPDWKNKFSGRVTDNKGGGLLIENQVGYPFEVNGSFLDNGLFGVSLIRAHGTWVRGCEIARTYDPDRGPGSGGGVGFGVYVFASTWLFVFDSLICDNVQGVGVQTCGPSPTKVGMQNNRLYGNSIAAAIYDPTASCASQGSPILYLNPNNVCSAGGCSDNPVPIPCRVLTLEGTAVMPPYTP